MNNGISSLGEAAILATGYTLENGRCNCGELLSRCEYWDRVESELKKEFNDQEYSLASSPLSIRQQGKTTHRKIPTLVDVLLILGSRRLWDLGERISVTVRQFRSATNMSLKIFETVAKLNNTSIIVDSSKYPLPLKSMYLAIPERIRVIFLIRDGRAVSRSLMHRQNLNMEQAARQWVRFNWNIKLVMQTIPAANIYTLRYEDLCTDTDRILAELSGFIGTPSPLQVKPLAKDTFHSVGGNPMRSRRDETTVVLDEKWKTTLSKQDLAIFERIGRRMNRNLGYL